MTTDEALRFLRSHQPLPPTRVIDERLLKQFDEVRKYFAENLDIRCVPLLLSAFGEGDGHGIYQLVEDTVAAYPDEIVVPALLEGLRSPHSSVREWCAEIAANYVRPEFVSSLASLLQKGSIDEQLAAVAALSLIESNDARLELENALRGNLNPEVKAAIQEALRP